MAKGKDKGIDLEKGDIIIFLIPTCVTLFGRLTAFILFLLSTAAFLALFLPVRM